jgi:hypothetical protein
MTQYVKGAEKSLGGSDIIAFSGLPEIQDRGRGGGLAGLLAASRFRFGLAPAIPPGISRLFLQGVGIAFDLPGELRSQEGWIYAVKG